MKKVRSPVVDWLKLEREIRSALRDHKTNKITSATALLHIDNILGDETGRGWELEEV